MQSKQYIVTVLDYDSIGLSISNGMREYIERHRLPWQLVALQEKRRLPKPIIGVIGFVKKSQWEWASGLGCPVVQLSSVQPYSDSWVQIVSDDDAIGDLAARHLLEQGYRNFLCAGPWQSAVCRSRYGAFIAALMRNGYRCLNDTQEKQVLDPENIDFRALEQAWADWLRSFPKPLAIFAHQDRTAEHYTRICVDYGLSVPSEVAILGVDDLEDVCERSRPKLSSVVLPWKRIGFLGGLYLHRMQHGERLSEVVKVSPFKVTVRESTSRPAVDDALVARCLERLDERYMVADFLDELVKDLNIDRSTLYRRFIAALGSGPGEFIQRRRLIEAQRLLTDSALSVDEIARRVGYRGHRCLLVPFTKWSGYSPRDYRRRLLGNWPDDHPKTT